MGDITMSLKFIKQINEYVIESLLEADSDDILSMIDCPNYPTSEDISIAAQLVEQAIQKENDRRFEENKAEYATFKARQNSTREVVKQRSIPAMISDIVSAMQNTEEVPKGIVVAFREQQDSASDEDIKEIWQSLFDLGLIKPEEND